MPELPEVERVRLTLLPRMVGATVERVALARGRRDIVTGPARPADLLQGCLIAELRRKGKQLAIIARPGDAKAQASRVLIVHLGMSGQLLHLAPGASPDEPTHVHATWHLADRATSTHERGPRRASGPRLLFRDPRRFGGLWTLPTLSSLELHWRSLGPDALNDDIAPALAGVARSTRAIKAALLDQAVLAGVGNIYADESLHLAGVSPTRPCRTLREHEIAAIARAVPAILRRALDAGGSTLRDYRDASGAAGTAQTLHAVYGRGGQPCASCGTTLRTTQVAQRTTVWCPRCQE